MSFLALSPAAAWVLLAGVAAVILLLHLLRPPAPRATIASIQLWTKITQARKHPARQLLMLLLALGAGLSLALALTRPEIPAIGAAAQRWMLILDNSASMAARTRDGRSRWQHAIEQARALLQQSSAATEVVLVDTTGRLPWSGFIDRDAALGKLAQLPEAQWGSIRSPPAAPGAGVQVHLFTDGVAHIDAPAGTTVHSVFEAADNFAVTAFDARPLTQDPTRYEALIQVLNASPSDQRVRLLITGENAFAVAQDLDLKAGETADAIFDLSDYPGGMLAAAIVGQQDAFALDDAAYAVIPPHAPKRVLLVTAGNPALEDALRNLPGVRLAIVSSERYPRTGAHDALVFDRFAPVQPPAAGALLFQPPPRNWLAGRPSVVAAPRVTEWKAGHAVTDGIAWPNLRLTRASLDARTDAADELVLAGAGVSGALVIAGEEHARWVKVGFALQDSNFPLQPDFPVFLGNALRWVTEPAMVLERGLGTIEVTLPGALVRDGSGTLVEASATAQGIVFEAVRPDVYTVSDRSSRVLVVAGLPDPSFALINQTRLSGAAGTTPAGRVGTASFRNLELWMMLLLLAGMLLLVEWAAFVRRLPV